ncbi:MAG: hypothetical protein ACNYNY_00580 [Candidatus Oxydemutatoraceae bacterium WSBS_2016_MAG_OTU14]
MLPSQSRQALTDSLFNASINMVRKQVPTITSLGVSHLIKFWLSNINSGGYRKFLDKIRAGEFA